MAELIIKNPWLGLESYKEGEILYGRDDDIRDLSQCVLNDTETLLYGKSGIGKSSILNAGILPIARRNGYLPVIIRLSHKDEHSYLYQINQAIVNAILSSQSNMLSSEDCPVNGDYIIEAAKTLIRELVTCKDPETESFYEYFHRHTFHNSNGDRLKLLIIFDQFEEIFTLQENAQKKKNFFANLADLLNDIMPAELQQKVDISSVAQENVNEISEGDIENIFDVLNLDIEDDLPEYVTDNDIHFVFTIREDFLSEFEYYSAAIPSLKQNRYGLRPINEEQASQIILRPIPGLVDKSVANLIIEKITNRKDFTLNGIPEIEVDSAVLSLYLKRLYEAKNGDTITKDLVEQKVGEIISDFYADALSGISPATIEYLEDMLLNGQGRRDSVSIYDAKNDGNISEEELDILCREKKLLRQFNHAGDIRIEYIHDILCPIVNSNRAARQLKQEEEQQNEKLKELKRQKRRRISQLGIVVLIIGVILYYVGFHMPISYRFASTTKQWGRFEGIEPLSKAEAAYRDFHYVLKKKGYFAKTYSSMECRDRFGNLTTNNGLSTYVLTSQLENITNPTQLACKWEFIMDPLDENTVIQERAYDKEGKLVFAVNYNQPSKLEETENSLKYFQKMTIGSYVDEQGLPLEILPDGYRFVRITYDENGRDMLIEYFDWDGNPSTNADEAYQTYYEYDDIGQCISMSSLNIYGKRMIDKAGNCGQIIKYDGYRRVEIISVDEFGRETAVNDGYSRATYEYDEHGRETKMSLWNMGEPASAPEFHHRETLYDDNANSVVQICVDENLQQVSQLEVRFDSSGNQLYYFEDSDGRKVIQNSEFDTDGNCVRQNQITIEGVDTIGVFNYVQESNVETREFNGEIYNEYINITTYDPDDNNKILEDVRYALDGEVLYKETHTYTNRGYAQSLMYVEADSVVYYDRGNILKGIEVSHLSPNRGYREISYYDEDTLLYRRTMQYLDRFDNMNADVNGSELAYYMVNARTNKRNNTAIAYLTRYGFPSRDTKYFTYDEKTENWVNFACDENGNANISSDYVLPEIYGGERNYTAVFIQCTMPGRRWDAVILESDNGVKIGDDSYDYNNFGQTDEIVCLNLTTMRIETYNLYELDYWSIYNSHVTQLEYELYYEHYLNYELSSGEEVEIVCGEIVDDEGYLASNGYEGDFIVLKWSDWDCTQSLTSFREIFDANYDDAKDIVLLPYKVTDDEIVYGDIIYLENYKGRLGLSISSRTATKSLYQEDILYRYNEWK